MKRYTVEQQGNRWVASDGSDHVEADDPRAAIERLVAGDDDGGSELIAALETARGAQALEESASRSAISIIRLLATNAPRALVEGEVALLGRTVARWLDGRDAK